MHHHRLDELELERIGVGMVSQMPPDVMYLEDLGVTKAIIKAIFKKKVVENYYEKPFGSRG